MRITRGFSMRGSTALAVCITLALAGALAACVAYVMLQSKEARIEFIKYGPDGPAPGMAAKVESVSVGLDDLLSDRDDVLNELEQWREGLGYAIVDDVKAEFEKVAAATGVSRQPATLIEALDLMKDLRDGASARAEAAGNAVARAEKEYADTMRAYGAFRVKSLEDYDQLTKDYVAVESTKNAELAELNDEYGHWLQRHTELALEIESARESLHTETRDAMRVLVQQDAVAAHLLVVTRRLTDPTALEESSAWLAKVIYVDGATSRAYVNAGSEQGLEVGQRLDVMDSFIPGLKKGVIVIREALTAGSIAEIVEVSNPDVPMISGDVLVDVPRIMPVPARAKPDGRIVDLDPDTNSVVIDLGARDKLRPQTAFAVFSAGAKGEHVFRGFVSVTRVGTMVSHAAVKSIVDPGDPMLVGDLISSPLFPSEVTFTLVGESRTFALNAEQIGFLLKVRGAVVGRQVDMNTDYLVLMDISSGSDEERAEWDKLLSDARRLRVPILTLRDVVPFIF